MTRPKMERKNFVASINVPDPEGRTITGMASTFGNVDHTDDIIHSGAFTKTIAERGNNVKLLWGHDINEPLGKITELQEQTDGLFMKAVISDTSRGRDALALLQDGAMDGLSIGFTPVKGGTKYKKDKSGNTIRHLNEIKLYEISLVSFPANEDARITSLKDALTSEMQEELLPEEGKPYKAFKRGDKWKVYKIDTDKNPVGKALGTHNSEEEANAQVRALYAAEDKQDLEVDPEITEKEEILVEQLETKEMTESGPIQRMGDVLQGSVHQTFTNLADSWYVQGMLDREERILLSNLIGDSLEILSDGIPEEVAMRELPVYPLMGLFGFSESKPEKQAEEEIRSEDEKSDSPPVTDEDIESLKLIEIEKIKNLTVEV